MVSVWLPAHKESLWKEMNATNRVDIRAVPTMISLGKTGIAPPVGASPDYLETRDHSGMSGELSS